MYLCLRCKLIVHVLRWRNNFYEYLNRVTISLKLRYWPRVNFTMCLLATYSSAASQKSISADDCVVFAEMIYFVCTFIDSYRSRIMVRIVSIQSWDYKKRPIKIWITTLLIISSPDLYLLSYTKFPELFQIISTIMSRGEKEESFWIYIRLIEIELRSGFWKVLFWVKTNTNLENIWTLKNIIHLLAFKQEGVLYFYFKSTNFVLGASKFMH